MPPVTPPGPPGFLPGPPDAVVDLQTPGGAALVGGEWRSCDAAVREVDFARAGADLGPSGPPGRTYDVIPHAEGVDFDDSGWAVLDPPGTRRRLGGGLVCFTWYRIALTVPERVGDLDPTGATVIFEVVVDDYAEVWVDGRLPHALGDTGGPVVGGFNAPNRVVLTTDARPGRRFQLAVFGINGPISASPANYVWLRGATLEFHAAERARTAAPASLAVTRTDPRLDALVPPGTTAERIATGFTTTAGPAWTGDGALLFGSPAANTVYRWAPPGVVTVFRPKAGYAGVDIGRLPRPGAGGLAFDPQGRLVICQRGNRRVVRVEPHGDLTVLAAHHRGRHLNGPADLAHRSDGALFFTDPPSGLPGGAGDPAREPPFGGVFMARDGELSLVTGALREPGDLAFSPDERHLYVTDRDPDHPAVWRHEVDGDGTVTGASVLHDLTAGPGDGDDSDPDGTGGAGWPGDPGDAGGLKVDRDGHLYVCRPSGIRVLTAGGEHLGTLRLPERPGGLAWGGGDARTLHVTTPTSVYRLRVAVPGAHPRPRQETTP